MVKPVSISRGNSKMGNVSSVSLPPVVTCGRMCEKCYANKLYKLRKTVRDAYDNNLEILKNEPERFWREVNGAIKSVTYFRFMVSGDIPNYEFLEKEIKVIKDNPHCQILQFTKRYDWVNKWIDENGELPSNLHLIFSAWRGVEMKNPHNLPTAHVLYRDGVTTANDWAFYCKGNCFTCFTEKAGCLSMKKGEQVIFKQH